MDAIFPIEQVDASWAPRIGGKGAMLGELHKLTTKLSFPAQVPSGLCVASDLFAEWLSTNGVSDAKLKNALDTIGKDTEKLESLSKVITEKLTNATLPLELAVLAKDLKGKLYAVRSSGVGEDGVTNSFAGQHDSFLNKAPLLVPEALRDVWLSAFNPRALYYRVARGITASPIRIGVVIQEMVNPKYAGVGFSADPRTGIRNQMLIEYVAGLGDNLVAGKVSPSVFVLEHDKIESHSKMPKEWHGLAHALVELQQILGWPVDVEWAFDQNFKLNLLQVRPITTLPDAPDDNLVKLKKFTHAKWGKPSFIGEPFAPGQMKSRGFITRQQALAYMAGKFDAYELPHRTLAVPFTTPDDLPIMEKVGAIVVTRGGITSHAAIVCREIGKPCIKIDSLKTLPICLYPYDHQGFAMKHTMFPHVIDGDLGAIYKLNTAYEVYT